MADPRTIETESTVFTPEIQTGADYEVALESLSQWQLAWRKYKKHGPPPWAPAHGYRRNGKHKHKHHDHDDD